MQHVSNAFIPVVALAVAWPTSSRAQVRTISTDPGVQTPTAVAHTVDVARGRASLELQLATDDVVNVTFARGEIRINGRPAGHYTPGGALETTWRTFLDSAANLNTGDVLTVVRRWPKVNLPEPDLSGRAAIAAAITTLTAVPRSELAQSSTPASPDFDPASPAFERSVERSVEEAFQNFDPDPNEARSSFAGVGPTLAGLLGAFVALASIAFGLVSFAPRQLDVVADTVQHSFIRSFFAGLFAQPLLLPALGVLVVALVLTIVGILVVPVAIVAFAVAVALGVVGGYIAAARALGEVYLRRKMARGVLVSADPVYRSVVIGLAGLLMIWVPFALLGWIPGLGIALLFAAVFFTWVMATVGLGATILSRGGLRGAFGRRIAPESSGELSWSTVDEIAPSKRGEGSVR